MSNTLNYNLERLFRNQKHILDEKSEKLMANYGLTEAQTQAILEMKLRSNLFFCVGLDLK